MTDDTMPLLDALLKRGGGDFMKGLAEDVLARLMAFDVEGQIGAGRFERSEARSSQRRASNTARRSTLTGPQCRLSCTVRSEADVWLTIRSRH